MQEDAIYCRCGERIKTRDVVRTDYFQRPNGREYVYVKFHCPHCKVMGETFVPEPVFDWTMFAVSRDELSEKEREKFSKQGVVSSSDVVDLHRFLGDERQSPLSLLRQNHAQKEKNAAPLPDASKPSKRSYIQTRPDEPQ